MTFSPPLQNKKPINSAVLLKQTEEDSRKTKQGNKRMRAIQIISLKLALLQIYEGQLGLGDSYTSVWMAVWGGREIEGAGWSAFKDGDDRAVDDWSVLYYCSKLRMDWSTCHHLAPQSEMVLLLSAFQQSVSVTKDCWQSEPLFHSTPSLCTHMYACTDAYMVTNFLHTNTNPIRQEGP